MLNVTTEKFMKLRFA